MKGYEKYTRQYFPVENYQPEWIKKDHVEKAPIWCSVDLRDGNQALVIPMDLEEKLEFFKKLVAIGFKEIEIGFPAASDTEYEFTRRLIEDDLIPDDVTIQVLTQAREHIIAKTFKAIEGAKHAIVHLYNSTSVAQRQQVFKKSKEEIKQLAVDGAIMCQKFLDVQKREHPDEHVRFEYSPESFTGTEVDYAVDVCNAVLDVWKPTKEEPVIINLPVTVELSMPHVYANQVEYVSHHLKDRDSVILSLHPHNDRGCGVADTEMGLLAGADRVEGTLFGNGERTGNVDIITLALNMYTQGVDPQLDFSNIPDITDMYARLTGMHVYARSPYTGPLVFAAFSGSHQDAIAKGAKWRKEHDEPYWTVPYLPLDPADIGRAYDADVIRINSQSGKGGIGYILENDYKLVLPKKMREEVGYLIKGISDRQHKEMQPEEVYQAFADTYLNIQGRISVENAVFTKTGPEQIHVTAKIGYNGTTESVEADGNGRLDAVSHAIKQLIGNVYTLKSYDEHAIDDDSNSRAAAYVSIAGPTGKIYWGVGIDDDIIEASIKALVSAVNRQEK